MSDLVKKEASDLGLPLKGIELVGPDDLKAIAYQLCSKQESITRTFTKQLMISKDDLLLLDRKISEKLTTHGVSGLSRNINIYTNGNKLYEFYTYDAFNRFDWAVDESTSNILLKWTFNLKVEGIDLPQPHTLSVRLLTEAKPINFLQVMLSQNDEEADKLALEMCSAICRVDYISASMGNELIAKFDEWLNQCPKNLEESKLLKVIRKRENLIANLIKELLPILLLVVTILIYYKFIQFPDTNRYIQKSLIYWFSFIVGFITLKKLLEFVEESFRNNLQRSSNRSMMFKITKGDIKNIEKIMQRKKKAKRHIVTNITCNALINIICGIIVYYLLPN